MSKLTDNQLAVLKNIEKPKTRRQTITEDEFAAIKMMKGTLSPLQTKELFGRSVATVSRIFKYDTLEDMKKRPSAGSPKKVKEVTEEVEEIKVDDTPNIEVTLERIAVAMERLADAWEASPRKRGNFLRG